WVPWFMSWAGFLFDTTAPWFLLARKTRPFAYVVVIVFHALTRVLFPIGVFPVIMVVSALVFFSPSWPRRWIFHVRRIVGGAAMAEANRDLRSGQEFHPGLPPLTISGLLHPTALQKGPSVEPCVRRGWRISLAVGAVYCLAQILVPLRFLAYGGDVHWHE